MAQAKNAQGSTSAYTHSYTPARMLKDMLVRLRQARQFLFDPSVCEQYYKQSEGELNIVIDSLPAAMRKAYMNGYDRGAKDARADIKHYINSHKEKYK